MLSHRILCIKALLFDFCKKILFGTNWTGLDSSITADGDIILANDLTLSSFSLPLANNLNEKTGGSRSDGIAGIAGEGGSNGEGRSDTAPDDKAQNSESKGGQGNKNRNWIIDYYLLLFETCDMYHINVKIIILITNILTGWLVQT